jgi:hypothetical protein
MGCRLCWLDLARRRCCHDRKKPGRFRRLATAALLIELARPVLPPPLEQHVGVKAIAQRQLRDRDLRFAGFGRQSALELDQVIESARPTPCRNFACVQNGPHYFIWRAPLSLTFTLVTRRPQNDANPESGSTQKAKRPVSRPFCFTARRTITRPNHRLQQLRSARDDRAARQKPSVRCRQRGSRTSGYAGSHPDGLHNAVQFQRTA